MFIAMLLTFASLYTLGQSPWVSDKGAFYGQISSTFINYSSIVKNEANTIIQTDSSTQDVTVSIYAEYNLTDQLGLLINFPFKSVTHDGMQLSGLGDPSVKLKYQVLENFPLGVYMGYTAPFSKREGVLRTGYRQHALDIGVSAGNGKKKSFLYGSLGFRYRNEISDQVLIEFEYGRKFSVAKKPFFMMFHLDGTLNASTFPDDNAGNANLYHYDAEFISPGLKMSYNAFKNLWLNIGAFSGVYIRNIGAKPSVNFGLAYKME